MALWTKESRVSYSRQTFATWANDKSESALRQLEPRELLTSLNFVILGVEKLRKRFRSGLTPPPPNPHAR